MRIKFGFVSYYETIPIIYRKGVLSILKKAFEGVSLEIYETFYSKNVVKPFTFSVYIPEAKFIEDRIELGKSKEIFLNFSTCYTDIGLMFYNGMVKNRNFRFQYLKDENGLNLILKNVILKREFRIKSDKVLFKTLSPLLVRKHTKGHKQKDEYLLLNKENLEEFENQMNVNMEPVFKAFMGKVYPLKIYIEKEGDIKNVPIKISDTKGNYGYAEGNIGKFLIEGHPDALDFIYKVGLGARRSYGFGMLEVVNEKT